MATRRSRMIQIYSPRSEIELLMLRSIFADAGIRHFVRNDTFGSLYLGPHVEAYNRKTLCVEEAEAEEAVGLLEEFLTRTGRSGLAATAVPEPEPGPFDRWLRRLLELFAPRLPAPQQPPYRLIRGTGDHPAGGRRPRPPLRLVR